MLWHGRLWGWLVSLGSWEEQVDFVRSMSPAAAKIMWILLLSGRSLTGKELEFACDLSDKPIKKGLAWLEFKGLVQNNGKFNGWSLTAAATQLALPGICQLGESRRKSDFLQLESRRISDHQPESRRFSDHGAPPSSSSSSKLIDQEEEEERKGESRRKSDFRSGPEKEKLRHCLVSAGIGPRSKKLKELLALELALDFVRAHIAAREALLASGEKYPISWLITKLLDGDPVPKPKQPKKRIPPDLEDIIKR